MTVLATVLYRLAVCHFGCRCEVAQKPQTVLKSALLMAPHDRPQSRRSQSLACQMQELQSWTLEVAPA